MISAQATVLRSIRNKLNLELNWGTYSTLNANEGFCEERAATEEIMKGGAMYLLSDQLGSAHYVKLLEEAHRRNLEKSIATPKTHPVARLVIRTGGLLIDLGYHWLQEDSAPQESTAKKGFSPSRRVL